MSKRIQKILARYEKEKEELNQEPSNTQKRDHPKEMLQFRQNFEKELGKCNISQRKKMFICLKGDQKLRVFAYPSKYAIIEKNAPLETMTISKEKASDFRQTSQVALVTVGPKGTQKFMCSKEGYMDVANYFICSPCPMGIRMQQLASWYTVRTVNRTTKDTPQEEGCAKEYQRKDIFGDISDVSSSDETVKSLPKKKKKKQEKSALLESSSTSSSKSSSSSFTISKIINQCLDTIYGDAPIEVSSDESDKPKEKLYARKRKPSPIDFFTLRKRVRKSSEKTTDSSKRPSLMPLCSITNIKKENESIEGASTSKVACLEGSKRKSLTPICSNEGNKMKVSKSTEKALPPSETKGFRPSIKLKPITTKSNALERCLASFMTPICPDEENPNKKEKSNEDSNTTPSPKRDSPGDPLKEQN